MSNLIPTASAQDKRMERRSRGLCWDCTELAEPNKVRCTSCREKELERYRKKHAERIAWLAGIKADSGCAHCKENDPDCLDFHHVNRVQKLFPIGMHCRGNVNRLLREIAKCIILCANCHRKEEARLRRQWIYHLQLVQHLDAQDMLNWQENVLLAQRLW